MDVEYFLGVLFLKVSTAVQSFHGYFLRLFTGIYLFSRATNVIIFTSKVAVHDMDFISA